MKQTDDVGYTIGSMVGGIIAIPFAIIAIVVGVISAVLLGIVALVIVAPVVFLMKLVSGGV